jgi:hypothetical protein
LPLQLLNNADCRILLLFINRPLALKGINMC